MKTLLVIDGNSIMNRQFYGIRPLTTKSGVFTNAVYGFLNVLFSVMDRLSPDYAAVAFDLHAPTFRHKMYDQYKAGRHKTPDELIMQFPYIKKCIRALGISVLEKEGYEADDILGTLAHMAELQGDTHAYVLTGDRDSLQLISGSCSVLLATNQQTLDFDEKAFIEKYGVLPSQFVDVKALMGDSSDNIPGVRGIGEKTALKLISDFKTLDALYEGLDSSGLTAKTLEKLLSDKESAYLSRELARINCQSPIGINSLDEILLGEKDKAALLELFNELEFSAFIKRLSLDTSEEAEAEEATSVDTDFISSFKSPSPVAFTLTDGIAQIYDGKTTYSVPVPSLSEISGFFESNRLIVHDSKSLMHTLEGSGVKECSISFDTMLCAYVINPSSSSYKLSSLAGAYLQVNSESAKTVWELCSVFTQKLKEEGTEFLFYDIELPLAALLFRMERLGFAVDKLRLADFSAMLENEICNQLEQIYSLAGRPFNVNSTKQLAQILFEELKLPAFKKTKSGFSTDAEVLEKLRPYHPIIDLILSYRQYAKLKSTYADGLLSLADSEGRVHSTFNQTVTATGRLSSAEPNLQNIPIRTPLGHELRRCFVAKQGYTLVDADYSQIELRLLAHISADPEMTAAFIAGEDIHSSTAAKVFGVEADQVTPEMRKRAKAINFGIVYGMGAFSLASDLGISRKEAEDYITEYKRKFEGVSEYLTAIIESAYKNGYVTTMLGRRRYIPELTSSKAMMKSFGERVAMNSPIQGSAADIIKIAMVRVDKALKAAHIDGEIILQVHDELILEVADADAQRAALILKEEMEKSAELSVPLVAEVSMGKTWYECK